jgi:hypothetical protein
VKPINQVASVDQIVLFDPADLLLLVAVSLIGAQVFDAAICHLTEKHVNKSLGVVIGFNMVEDRAKFQSSSSWTTTSIQSCKERKLTYFTVKN